MSNITTADDLLPEDQVDDENALSNFVRTRTAIMIATMTTILAVCISGVSIYSHLVHYTCPSQQRYIIRLLFTCPLYAVTSCLCLRFWQHAVYFETIRDCYEAFIIYSFLVLILEYAGGEANCVAKMQGLPPLRPPCPFCFLTDRPRTVRLLRECKAGTLQFVVLKPFMALVSLIMASQGKLYDEGYQIAMLIIYNLAYSVALYYLLFFYLATKEACKQFKPISKFAAVKSIVFATYYQSLLVRLLPNMTMERALLWSDFILCVEMVIFAIALSCVFSAGVYDLGDVTALPLDGSSVHGSGGGGGGSGALPSMSLSVGRGKTFGLRGWETSGDVELGASGGAKHQGIKRTFENARSVIGVRDVVQDLRHNFMPAYQDYVLQREDDLRGGVVNDGGGGTASHKKPTVVRRRTYLIGNLPSAIQLPTRGRAGSGGTGGGGGEKSGGGGGDGSSENAQNRGSGGGGKGKRRGSGGSRDGRGDGRGAGGRNANEGGDWRDAGGAFSPENGAVALAPRRYYFIGTCWGVGTRFTVTVDEPWRATSQCRGEGFNTNGFFSLRGTRTRRLLRDAVAEHAQRLLEEENRKRRHLDGAEGSEAGASGGNATDSACLGGRKGGGGAAAGEGTGRDDAGGAWEDACCMTTATTGGGTTGSSLGRPPQLPPLTPPSSPLPSSPLDTSTTALTSGCSDGVGGIDGDLEALETASEHYDLSVTNDNGTVRLSLSTVILGSDKSDNNNKMNDDEEENDDDEDDAEQAEEGGGGGGRHRRAREQKKKKKQKSPRKTRSGGAAGVGEGKAGVGALRGTTATTDATQSLFRIEDPPVALTDDNYELRGRGTAHDDVENNTSDQRRNRAVFKVMTAAEVDVFRRATGAGANSASSTVDTTFAGLVDDDDEEEEQAGGGEEKDEKKTDDVEVEVEAGKFGIAQDGELGGRGKTKQSTLLSMQLHAISSSSGSSSGSSSSSSSSGGGGGGGSSNSGGHSGGSDSSNGPSHAMKKVIMRPLPALGSSNGASSDGTSTTSSSSATEAAISNAGQRHATGHAAPLLQPPPPPAPSRSRANSGSAPPGSLESGGEGDGNGGRSGSTIATADDASFANFDEAMIASTFSPFFGERGVGVADDEDDDYDANDTVSSGLLGDSSTSTSSSAIRERTKADTKDGKNQTKKRGKKSKKQKKNKKSSGKETPAMNTVVMADVV